MEVVSAELGKVSDSVYSNSCSNSQSQHSSGSSKSRHTNRSESSGYCGGNPSNFGSSNGALPELVVERKEKEHKKKKMKALPEKIFEPQLSVDISGLPSDPASFAAVTTPELALTRTVELSTVVLVDATDPGEHNASCSDTGPGTQAGCPDDSKYQANEGFCAVISMHDGVVLYTTPTLSAALSFPKDMWIGRSFIDFLHPKDRTIFADQIKNGVASPDADPSKGINGRRSSLFCGLRKYRGAKCNVNGANGQRKTEKAARYFPFHLTLTFKDFRDHTLEQHPRAMFLVVTAQPVHSAYKAPEETIISSKFTTRHTATCHLSHVDPDVVQYFGHLPQEMVGRSLFEFYHPEDLPFIKDIYETVVKLNGTSFRSKPYRFAVKNGGYVVLETDWSSFINPWTRKLEFVVGQHRILKGPGQPDVFQPPEDDEHSTLANISEEVLKESKIIQDEIHALLSETICRSSEVPEHDVSRRCKDLASFMETLLHEVKAPCLKQDLPGDDRSFSEHDSVMLGEISPHHEYYDSKSSTETPPSYNQLNYNENIQRFFKSKPLVSNMYDGDDEVVNPGGQSADEEAKTSMASADPARKCMSPINGSGASGSGSAGNLSSGSNNQASSGSRGEVSNTTSNTTGTDSFKLPMLTESLLCRHNEDMEKMMVQKHRELRSSIKNSDKMKDSRMKSAAEKIADPSHCMAQSHGVKRSGSRSWKGESSKVPKHDDAARPSPVIQPLRNNAAESTNKVNLPQGHGNTNCWPSLSAAAPPLLPSDSCTTMHSSCFQAAPGYPAFTQIIPVFYFPVPQNRTTSTTVPLEHPGPPSQSQSIPQNPYIQYMATGTQGIMYPATIRAPASAAMMYRPFIIPEPASMAPKCPKPAPEEQKKPLDAVRPASQATSVKAEPGSIMAISESSKKVLSSGGIFSPCDSAGEYCLNHTDKMNAEKAKRQSSDYNEDESSYSSLYSSFLNKSCESIGTTGQKGTGSMQQETTWEKTGASERSKRCIIRKEPPWLEGVTLTPELMYQYQMSPKVLDDVLQADMKVLRKFQQPHLVNDQLNQLYLDLEIEGFVSKMLLDECTSSSGSDSASNSGCRTDSQSQHEPNGHSMEYDKLVMIHEENAPFPPPQTRW